MKEVMVGSIYSEADVRSKLVLIWSDQNHSNACTALMLLKDYK